MTLNGMESLLSHTYFETENKTEMYSDVITAILPSVNNTNLTEPVNFTIHHKKVLLNSSALLFFFFKTTYDLLSFDISENLCFSGFIRHYLNPVW